MSYNTYITYNGDGATTDYAIPFPYTDASQVKVTRLNGAVTVTFLNASLIRINAALAISDQLTITRETDLSTPAVLWQSGNDVNGPEVNQVIAQVLNGIQEAKDKPGPAGPIGPIGGQGIQGVQGPAGPGWNQWKGVWSSATAYIVNDAVQYNGSSYIAILAGTNKQPDTQTTYWNLVALKGSTGASGSGTGDMLKATYDSNNNGVVDTAEAVAWTGVTGKPTFATVATTGAYSDLTGKPTLGTAAALDVGTIANKVVQLDGSAKLPAVDGSALLNLPASGNPAGTVLNSLATSPPTGYLAGDAVYTTSSYAALQAVIGSLYPDTVTVGTGSALTGFTAASTPAFCASNGATVLMANGSSVYSKSTDAGSTWSALTNAPGIAATLGMAYANGRWLVVGSSGATAFSRYSTDLGATAWSVGSTQFLNSLASNGTIFVAQNSTGGNTSNTIMSSSDGVTWTNRFTFTGLAGTSSNTIAIIGGPFGFIATADDTNNAGGYAPVATSPDGINWTQTGVSVGVGLTVFVASDDGKYMLAGGTISANYVYRSTDYGYSFNKINLNGNALIRASGAFINGRWILADNAITGTLATYTAFETGAPSLAWTKRTSSALSPVPTTTIIGTYFIRKTATDYGQLTLRASGTSTYRYLITDRSYDSATQFYVPPLTTETYVKRYVKT
jgi:hypothetical protein